MSGIMIHVNESLQKFSATLILLGHAHSVSSNTVGYTLHVHNMWFHSHLSRLRRQSLIEVYVANTYTVACFQAHAHAHNTVDFCVIP